MKTLTNAKVNRWKQLIEYDIEKLEVHLDNITAKPLDSTENDISKLRDKYDKTMWRYELAPGSKEGIERQIREDREVLEMLNKEIEQMTFAFGFKGQQTQEPETNLFRGNNNVKPN